MWERLAPAPHELRLQCALRLQDALIYGALLDAGEAVEHRVAPGRRVYVHVATGAVMLNGEAMGAGDGAQVESEPLIRIEGVDSADLLLFDLP